MQKVKVKDKEFEIYIPEEELMQSISQVANRMNQDLQGKNPLFLGILNGAFMFASELFKRINTDCQISFVKYASYHGVTSTGQVSTLIGANEEVTGRTVVILEDIIDSGITMEKVVADIEKHNPADIKIATMLFKPDAFKRNYPIHYIGKEIPNDFILGFGLDYDGYGRNLRDIYKLI
jgi:hypoxanthine phosphoribosyltransferase